MRVWFMSYEKAFRVYWFESCNNKAIVVDVIDDDWPTYVKNFKLNTPISVHVN